MARLFAPAPRPRITRYYAARVPHHATRELAATPAGRVTVHCRNGEAWITHDGDPRDVTLRPSQSYTAERCGRMTLHAIDGDCVLEIQIEE